MEWGEKKEVGGKEDKTTEEEVKVDESDKRQNRKKRMTKNGEE